jgi:uncharacterized membrane protein
MNIVNERVEHIMFGLGVITEVYDNKIVVQFQERLEQKYFYIQKHLKNF